MTRYRDLDRRFKTATDAQLQAWEADQPTRGIRKRSWIMTLKEIAGACLAVFLAGFFMALLGGQLQGLW